MDISPFDASRETLRDYLSAHIELAYATDAGTFMLMACRCGHLCLIGQRPVRTAHIIEGSVFPCCACSTLMKRHECLTHRRINAAKH